MIGGTDVVRMILGRADIRQKNSVRYEKKGWVTRAGNRA